MKRERRKSEVLWAISVLMAIVVMLFLVTAIQARAETLKWDNPTTYVDGTPIADLDMAAIKTVIEIKGPGDTSWTVLATTQNGESTWSGSLPSVYKRGDDVAFRAKAALHDVESAYCDQVNYTIPFIAPDAPGGMRIINITVTEKK